MKLTKIQILRGESGAHEAPNLRGESGAQEAPYVALLTRVPGGITGGDSHSGAFIC